MNHDGGLIEPELVRGGAAGLVTPGSTLTRMRQVDADVHALDAELSAQRGRLPAAFLRGWAHWRESWTRFFRDHESFAQRVWPGTALEVESFARRLRDWRSGAQRVGAELTTPDVSRPGPSIPTPRLPDLPSMPAMQSLQSLGEMLPGLPDLSPLRELAEALPNAARALPNALTQPVREALEQSPLSARFWESVRPVAIAGALTVGGLGLLWVLVQLRSMSPATRIGTPPSGASAASDGELERALPMLLSRGVIR